MTEALTSFQISISAGITAVLAFYPGFIQNQQNIKLSNVWGKKGNIELEWVDIFLFALVLLGMICIGARLQV